MLNYNRKIIQPLLSPTLDFVAPLLCSCRVVIPWTSPVICGTCFYCNGFLFLCLKTSVCHRSCDLFFGFLSLKVNSEYVCFSMGSGFSLSTSFSLIYVLSLHIGCRFFSALCITTFSSMATNGIRIDVFIFCHHRRLFATRQISSPPSPLKFSVITF